MRLLALAFVLFSLALSSCRRGEGMTNANSAGLSRSKSNETSNARPNATQPCVNLNTATAKELESLPGIGDVIARRIIDYREHQGRFRRPEEIIIIQGLSEKKYRAIAGMVCVE